MFSASSSHVSKDASTSTAFVKSSLSDREGYSLPLGGFFDTVENGQNADVIALQMVQDVYAPIIKAIDSSYRLHVEFKQWVDMPISGMYENT